MTSSVTVNMTSGLTPTVTPVQDIDGLIQVFQVPLDGSQAVPQLIGGPVHFLLGGSASFQQQLAPSAVEALRCIHGLLHLPVGKQGHNETPLLAKGPLAGLW